jgi:formylglycine-generating enzyme required for sulfatase activity
MKKRSCFDMFSAGIIALNLCLTGVAHGADSPEDVFWKSVRKANLADEYQLYIEQYPKGKHVWEAKGLIKQLEVRTFHPGKIFKDCPDCPEMVVIPVGKFDMGGTSIGTEQPIHSVSLKAFAMGKTEVTQGQWEMLMGSNPSKFAQCGYDCPVENVSWDDAQGYIRKLNQKTGKTYRLPSEAEWEYACRAGGNDDYCGSDSIDSVAWHGGKKANSDRMSHPVASKQPNAWGLYDMSGNTWEWTLDCWNANYTAAPTDGRAWTAGECAGRVLRGGSWLNPTEHTRSTARSWSRASDRLDTYGFRLVRALP